MTELLCIQTHSKGVVKAGNTYLLISDMSPCKCNDLIDVGIRNNPNELTTSLNGDIRELKTFEFTRCKYCYQIVKNNFIWWISKELFAEIGQIDELEQYKQKEKPIEIEINQN